MIPLALTVEHAELSFGVFLPSESSSRTVCDACLMRDPQLGYNGELLTIEISSSLYSQEVQGEFPSFEEKPHS